ncbi:8-oxo-dGTP diphosphatase [compost metagenome]
MVDYTLCIIFNRHHDKVLLLQRNFSPYKGLFNGIGGKVKYGESHTDAVIREVKEETGIELDYYAGNIFTYSLKLVFPTQETNLHVYYAEVEEGTNRIACREGTLHWIDVREVLNITDPRWAGDGNLSYFVLDALRLMGHKI